MVVGVTTCWPALSAVSHSGSSSCLLHAPLPGHGHINATCCARQTLHRLDWMIFRCGPSIGEPSSSSDCVQSSGGPASYSWSMHPYVSLLMCSPRKILPFCLGRVVPEDSSWSWSGFHSHETSVCGDWYVHAVGKHGSNCSGQGLGPLDAACSMCMPATHQRPSACLPPLYRMHLARVMLVRMSALSTSTSTWRAAAGTSAATPEAPSLLWLSTATPAFLPTISPSPSSSLSRPSAQPSESQRPSATAQARVSATPCVQASSTSQWLPTGPRGCRRRWTA